MKDKLKYFSNAMNKFKKRIGLLDSGGVGFSLIELLVGIAIIITTTTVILAIIMSSFRISSKSTTLEQVRQSGNYAVSQMSRTLQFADSFEGVSDTGAVGSYVMCSATPRTFSYIQVIYAGSPVTFSCQNSGITKNGQPMISSGISVVSGSCSFTCTQENAEIAPVIKIKFDLYQGDANTVVEKKSVANFSTSVKMRNLR